MDDIFQNTINPEHLGILCEEFFKGNPVSISKELQGQGLDENSNFVLGCSAGPSTDVSNLIHEMSHLAELEVPRLLKKPYGGWGFKWGKYWELNGHSGYEPRTDQSVRREMRTWAYQWSIHQSLQIPVSNYDDESKGELIDLVRSSTYLHAFANYKWAVLSQEERDALGYSASEQKTLEILADEVLHLSQTVFTFDNFCKNWKERMDLLKSQK